MNISTVVSNKGNEKLFIDGYGYHLARKKKNFQLDLCKKKNYSCNVRVVTHLVVGKHEVIKMPSSHSHAPIPTKK